MYCAGWTVRRRYGDKRARILPKFIDVLPTDCPQRLDIELLPDLGYLLADHKIKLNGLFYFFN